jgi:enoyl-CoA hydratase
MADSIPSLVSTEIRGRVAILTLTNERRRNSITLPMVDQFVDALAQVQRDDQVGAIVVTGAGEAFCAGADLRHLSKASGGDADAQAAVRGVYVLFERIYGSSLPTIAAVNGAAVGAGMNLALACDLRIVAESAMFSTRFLDLGLHPGGGHTWMLRQAVGPQVAAALVLFNQDLVGRDAERLGLAWSCVADSDLLTSAIELAEGACRGPRPVVEVTKQTIRDMRTVAEYGSAIDYEIEKQLWSAQQDAFKERIAARTR